MLSLQCVCKAKREIRTIWVRGGGIFVYKVCVYLILMQVEVTITGIRCESTC